MIRFAKAWKAWKGMIALGTLRKMLRSMRGRCDGVYTYRTELHFVLRERSGWLRSRFLVRRLTRVIRLPTQ